jgi:VanZ family protein
VITDFLLRHPWISPAILASIVVLGPVAASRLATRTRLTWWLTATSLLPLSALTLVPQHRRLPARCTFQWQYATPGRVELMANVVLFVGPVMLAAVASRSPARVFIGAVAVSALIEGVQAGVPSIGRSCDTSDWLNNSIGAGIGAVLGAFALGLARRRRDSGTEANEHGCAHSSSGQAGRCVRDPSGEADEDGVSELGVAGGVDLVGDRRHDRELDDRQPVRHRQTKR